MNWTEAHLMADIEAMEEVMSDDLVKQLRNAAMKRDGFDAVYLAEPAANRIEELEAKLVKAVKLIELAVNLGRWDLNPSFRDEMIDFTAELTGCKDE